MIITCMHIKKWVIFWSKEIAVHKIVYLGHQLQVTLVETDGGFSDEQSKPENLLNASWTDSSPGKIHSLPFI